VNTGPFTLHTFISSAGAVFSSPTLGLYLTAGEIYTLTASAVPNVQAHFWLPTIQYPESVFTVPAPLQMLTSRVALVVADAASSLGGAVPTKKISLFCKSKSERKETKEMKNELLTL